MRLTLFTDYTLRVLMYLGTRPDQLCSIAEIARGYGISQNHLMKVVNELVRHGYVESVRGRNGGVRLRRTPEDINIGAVVRYTEDSFALLDCASCVVQPACRLTGIFQQATRAFLEVLDQYTLRELLVTPEDLARLFLTDPPPMPGADGHAEK